MQTNIRPLTCLRCNWSWYPRKIEIRICPHCKSAYWDRPRTPLTPDPYRAIIVESGAILSGQVGSGQISWGGPPPGGILILSGAIISGGLT